MENEKRLLLDAGNLLFNQSKVSEDATRERLTAESIIDIYTEVEFDAVGVGPMDLSGSIDFLKSSSKNGFPWISANLYDGQGRPLFQQWVHMKAGDVEIRITALTGKTRNTPPNFVRHEPESILPNILDLLTKNNTDVFIIVLSTLTNEENMRIAAQYPDINLIIGADPRRANISPHSIQGCLVTQTAIQGKYQGIMQIDFGTQRRWDIDTTSPLADLQSRKESLQRQLRRLEEKVHSPEKEDKFQRSILRLHKEKDEIDIKIGLRQETLAAEKKNGVVNDQFSHRFVGLQTNMPTDENTDKRLLQLKDDIETMHKEK